ncbi:MAG: metallopeptidase TldD-related protein [Candidatus Cloacimonadota bacterium]|nr:metallopeptidase TldD-related protein [Candidatus Cloacimonadota bacterium]
MIDIKKIKGAVSYIKNNCTADDYTIGIYAKETLDTRFAQNAVTQHISGDNLSVHLEVAFGNRTGSASINQIEENFLDNLIEDASAIAKANEPDPEYVATEGPKKILERSNFSQNTADVKVEDVIQIIAKAVENAKSKEAQLSGMSTKNVSYSFVQTKNGFVGEDKHSDYDFSMTLKKEGVETKVSQGVKDFQDFSIDEMISRINSQFDLLSNPKEMEAQKISVIIRPQAVSNLFGFLFWMMNRRDADEGVSAFSGQEGKQFFGEKFTLESTFENENLSGGLFSHDGLIAKNLKWVENGILKNQPTSRFWAKENNLEPNFPFNFRIAGGEMTEEEMMKEAGKGLIINNFWYIRFVDQKRGELTGMTRDGVLYFEDGKIKHSVNNFRWNEIINEVTQRIYGLGKEELISSGTSVPTLLIKDFNFVDKTSF